MLQMPVHRAIPTAITSTQTVITYSDGEGSSTGGVGVALWSPHIAQSVLSEGPPQLAQAVADAKESH